LVLFISKKFGGANWNWEEGFLYLLNYVKLL
jgi:hypothetical protein